MWMVSLNTASVTTRNSVCYGRGGGEIEFFLFTFPNSYTSGKKDFMIVLLCTSHSDLGDDETCMVIEEPKPGPKGARARAKLAMIGQQVTNCRNGSTCVQKGIKEYRCELEEDSKPFIRFEFFQWAASFQCSPFVTLHCVTELIRAFL